MDPNMHPFEQVPYGYYCSGFLPMSPRHKGPDIQYTGAQNEILPYGNHTANYVYGYARSPYHPYIPTYAYAESPYNRYIPTYGYSQSPYNPYMPGPFVGAQQYQPAVSSPAFMTSSSSPESLIDNGALVIRPDGRGSKRQFNSTFGASDDGRGSKRYFHSNFGAFSNSTKPTSKASVGPRISKQAATNKAASSPVLQENYIEGGKCCDSTQALDSLANGEIPSHGSNNISDFGVSNHGRATVAKLQPEVNVGTSLDDINSGLDSLGEQNQDPKNQLASKSYTSRAGGTNAQGNNASYADQNKKDDFPVDYTDAKFFVIKSRNVGAVRLSIAYNVWPCCRPRGTKKLNSAYEEAQRIAAGKPRGCPIFLFFSVIGSGEFCGVAEMIGPVDFNKGMDFGQRGKWGGSFPVKWHMMKVLPYSGLCHILLENNENKPVTHSTDTQEIMYSKGLEMLILYKNHALLSLPHDFMYYPNHQKATFESPFFVPNLCFVAIDTLKTSDYEDEDDDDDDLEKQIEAAKARTIDSPPPDMPVWDEPYKGDYLKLTPIIIDRFSVAEVIMRIDLERAGVKVKDYTELRKIIAEVVELQPYKQDCLGPDPIILEKAAIDEYISRKFPKNDKSEKTGVEANLDISSLDLGPLMVDLHPYELRHESHDVSTLNIGRLSVSPNPIEARDDVSTSLNIGRLSVNPKPVFANTGTFDVTVGSVSLKFNA